MAVLPRGFSLLAAPPGCRGAGKPATRPPLVSCSTGASQSLRISPSTASASGRLKSRACIESPVKRIRRLAARTAGKCPGGPPASRPKGLYRRAILGTGLRAGDAPRLPRLQPGSLLPCWHGSDHIGAKELVERAEHALAIGDPQAAEARVRDLGERAAEARGPTVRTHLDVGKEPDHGKHALDEVPRQAVVGVAPIVAVRAMFLEVTLILL